MVPNINRGVLEENAFDIDIDKSEKRKKEKGVLQRGFLLLDDSVELHSESHVSLHLDLLLHECLLAIQLACKQEEIRVTSAQHKQSSPII